MPLQRLVYISEARADLSKADLAQIRSAAERNNWRADITGCLLFSGRSFAQMLEGKPAAIDTLLARLQLDDRHHDLKVLERQRCAKRRFAGWSMGFVYRPDVADLIDELFALSTGVTAMVEELVGQFAPGQIAPRR